MLDTRELINKITPETDIEDFISHYKREFRNITIKELLNAFLSEKGLRVSDVASASGHGEYVYKVFNGERKASRDVMISIAVGLKLDMEEVQMLLTVSKYAKLDPRDIKDLVCIFAIKSQYSIIQLNDMLLAKGFDII